MNEKELQAKIEELERDLTMLISVMHHLLRFMDENKMIKFHRLLETKSSEPRDPKTPKHVQDGLDDAYEYIKSMRNDLQGDDWFL